MQGEDNSFDPVFPRDKFTRKMLDKKIDSHNLHLHNNLGIETSLARRKSVKVYLVRHGKSVAPAKDPSQPLSEEGREEIRHMARTLANMNLKVGTILHSGKLRAKETALEIAEVIKPAGGVKEAKGLAPNDDPAEAMEWIDTAGEDLMVVSHLPFLDNLLEELVKPAQAEEMPSFDSGALVGVEKVNEVWKIFRQLGPRMIY